MRLVLNNDVFGNSKDNDDIRTYAPELVLRKSTIKVKSLRYLLVILLIIIIKKNRWYFFKCTYLDGFTIDAFSKILHIFYLNNSRYHLLSI